jgi:hypothetical protein
LQKICRYYWGFAPNLLFSTEVNVKKVQLSPVTSLLVSLTLVVGILVAGLTNSRVIPAASAAKVTSRAANDGTLVAGLITATGVVINGVATDGVFVSSVGIGHSVVESPCGIAALGGGVYALGVITSGNRADGSPSKTGVITSGEIAAPSSPGPGDDSPSVTGVITSGEIAAPNTQPSKTGVITSGEIAAPNTPPSATGVITSGELPDGDGPVSANGVITSGNFYVGKSLNVIGGVLTGENIRVKDGIIRGKNLRVEGAYVSSPCAP